MANEKATERSILQVEFGIAMQPLAKLIDFNRTPTQQEIDIAIAQFNSGWGPFTKKLNHFFHLDRHTFLDDAYSYLCRGIRARVETISKLLILDFKVDAEVVAETLKAQVAGMKSDLVRGIDRVPLDWAPQTFEANTPYSAYLRILDVANVAKFRFDYFDRYLKRDFYDLFLRNIPRGAVINIVTTAIGVKDVSAVSQIAAKEFEHYKLIEVTAGDIHDRNMRVDDQLFALGPGVDRAGIAITNFGPADSSDASLQAFEAIIAGGTIIHQS